MRPILYDVIATDVECAQKDEIVTYLDLIYKQSHSKMTEMGIMTLQLLLIRDMYFQTIQDVLRAAATSHQQYIRDAALNRLEELKENNFQEFIEQMLELLKSEEYDIHIIVYSYLLNGWILKTSRITFDLPRALEHLYSYFMELDRQAISFQTSQYRFRRDNVVKLAVAYYSKPQHMTIAENYVKRLALEYMKPSVRELLAYHGEVFEGMNEILEPCYRMRIGVKTSSIFMKSLEEIWKSNNREDKRYVIFASYYSTLFSSSLFESMSTLMNDMRFDSLIWPLVARLKSAITDYRFYPCFDKCIEVYQRVKILAGQIDLSRVAKRGFNNEGQNQEFSESFQKVLILLSDLLSLLQGSLACLFRKNLNQYQQLSLSQEILNLREFTGLVTWLIQLNWALESDNSEEFNNPIKETVLSIIQILSQRMSQEDLNIFFTKLKVTMNPENKEEILSLLFGANRQMLELFDCQSIITKMVNYQFDIPLKGSYVYYLLIGKYLKTNQYFVSQQLFADIYQFLMKHIQLHETMLNSSNNSKQSNHHILKITHLLTIGTHLINYPWTHQYRDYLPYFLRKIFYYLSNSCFGLPETAYENLVQAIQEVISKGNVMVNMSISEYVVEVYSECFMRNIDVELTKKKITCRVQQELLSILRESINSEGLKNPAVRVQLNEIFKRPPEGDEVILREIVRLLLKVFLTYNKRLISLNPQEFLHETKQYFDIPYERLSPIFLDSLNLEQIYAEIYGLVIDNYQEPCFNRVDNLIYDFQTMILLVLELSMYQIYLPLVDFVVSQLILACERSDKIYDEILKAVFKKPPQLQKSIKKLSVISMYSNCILESLYLNPLWRSKPSPIKQAIANSPLFSNCKANVDSLYATSVTEMMKHVSLQENTSNQILWSGRYSIILRDSVAKHIIDGWFINFQAM